VSGVEPFSEFAAKPKDLPFLFVAACADEKMMRS
jgi:hypothetical protein